MIETYMKLMSYSIENTNVPHDDIFNEMLKFISSKIIFSKIEGVFEVLRILDFYRGDAESLKRKQKHNFQEVHIEKLHELERLSQTKNVTIENVKETLKTISYVPLSHSFDRYYPMVEELSKRLGKKVKFKILGEEVFVPREMTGELNDALMHMIRNGLDHGIETNEARLQKNKPVVSNLEIESTLGEGTNVKLSFKI